MKTKVLSIILLGASLGLGSCSDYLDMTPTDRASDKLVWSKLDYAEQAVNDFYRYIDYLGAYRDGQCLAGMTEYPPWILHIIKTFFLSPVHLHFQSVLTFFILLF